MKIFGYNLILYAFKKISCLNVYVMHKQLKEIENEWKTMTVFPPFIKFCNDNIQNEGEKNMTCIVKCVYQSYIMGSKAIFRLMYCF